MQRVSTLCGCSGWFRVCAHPTPRKGCRTFHRSLNFPENPWGKTPWVLRAIDAPTNNMQAIQTKYLPATNYRGSRVKATCERGSITIPFPYDKSGDAIHREAALQLLERFVSEDWTERAIPPSQNPWKREFVTGCLPDGTMAHILL